jgi:hypothetical protein
LPCVLAGVALVVAGCGGKSDEEKREEARQEAKEREAAERAEARREALQRYERCNDRVEDFFSALQELNSRLDVGLSYDDYTDQVADVKVAYDQADFGNLHNFDCLRAAVPGEKALNQYVEAAGAWGDCIEDFNCDIDNIDLNGYWLKASVFVDRAQTNLSDLKRVERG